MRSMTTLPAVRRRRPLTRAGPAPSFATDETRWNAVKARDRAPNALAVAIPSHRVVRRDGGLSGYRWGTERKRALLQREEAEG